MDRIDHLQAHVEVLAQPTAHVTHQTQVLEAHTRIVAQRRHWRPGMACAVIMLLGALGMALGHVTPAHADVISCGDTLGPGGRFLLEADLDCGTVSPALTVRDGAHLDLGGHTIRASTSFSSFILLVDGQGAVVINGIVQDTTIGLIGSGTAIVVTGEGGHTVR